MQCKAKAKSTGVQCRRRAVTGYAVCQVHGAGSVKQGRVGGRPISSGKYSKRYQTLISNERAKQFNEALQDPEMLSLVSRIALLDVRIQELLENFGSRESPKAWELVRKLVEKIEKVSKSPSIDCAEKVQTIKGLLDKAKSNIECGMGEYYEWKELREVIESTRRLISTEANRVKMASEIITMEEARVFVNRVMEFVHKYLDRNEFTAFVRDLEQELV